MTGNNGPKMPVNNRQGINNGTQFLYRIRTLRALSDRVPDRSFGDGHRTAGHTADRAVLWR